MTTTTTTTAAIAATDHGPTTTTAEPAAAIHDDAASVAGRQPMAGIAARAAVRARGVGVAGAGGADVGVVVGPTHAAAYQAPRPPTAAARPRSSSCTETPMPHLQ